MSDWVSSLLTAQKSHRKVKCQNLVC